MEALEPALAPKVSVRIHGDFNTNNVILNPRTDALHFIDVHRSGHGDYLQDLSVLLVSLVRNPLGERRLDADMERLEALIVVFGAGFAAHVADGDLQRRRRRLRALVASARRRRRRYRMTVELSAVRAARAFGLLFTGVDLVERSDGGFAVFEVSAFGGFRGLREACGVDAAPLFARAALERFAAVAA